MTDTLGLATKRHLAKSRRINRDLFLFIGYDSCIPNLAVHNWEGSPSKAFFHEVGNRYCRISSLNYRRHFHSQCPWYTSGYKLPFSVYIGQAALL